MIRYSEQLNNVGKFLPKAKSSNKLTIEEKIKLIKIKFNLKHGKGKRKKKHKKKKAR